MEGYIIFWLIINNITVFLTLKEIVSIKDPIHVIEAAKLGANIGTLPPSVIRALINHPLTDSGIEKFKEDWEKANL